MVQMFKLQHFLCFIILALVLRFPKSLASRPGFVTSDSILKLQNVHYQYRLHSHNVKYGSGSGQQSVTGVDSMIDNNSHWIVKRVSKSATAETNFSRGDSIKCGDIIRLQHLVTTKNLHSHIFTSPLSGGQEVSAYGEDGIGDTGDHWQVVCNFGNWRRDATVHLKHVDTEMYLAMSDRSFGGPISGQKEVVGLPNMEYGSGWKCAEGVYILPKEKEHEHTEL